MITDYPMLHLPEGDDDENNGQQPRTDVTPEQWLWNSVNELVAQYSELTGFGDPFVTFRVEDEMVHTNRTQPVYDLKDIVESITQYGTAITQLRNAATLQTATLSVIQEQIGAANLDEDSKDVLTGEFMNIKGMLMQALHMLNAIDLSVYESANRLTINSRTHAIRQRRIQGNQAGRTLDFSTHVPPHDQHPGAEGGGLDQPGEQQGPRQG